MYEIICSKCGREYHVEYKGDRINCLHKDLRELFRTNSYDGSLKDYGAQKSYSFYLDYETEFDLNYDLPERINF